MPTSSCIQHPKRHKFIVIRDHVRNLFDGDVCSAALLSVFEYLTNGELDRQEDKEIPAGTCAPWIEISNRALCQHMIGISGKSAVLERIDRLVGFGILNRETGGDGLPNRYLLNFEFVNSLLEEHRTLSETRQGGVSEIRQVPIQNQTGTCLESDRLEQAHKELGVLQEERTEEVEEDVGAKLDDEEQNKPTFKEVSDKVATLYREHHKHKPSFWGSARGSGEKLMELVERYGLPYVTQVLDNYLGLDDRELHKERHSITVFCRGFSKWAVLPTYASPAAQTAPLPVAEGGSAVTHAEPEPGSSNGRKTGNALPLPEAAVAWNETVTAGPPVEGWSVRDKPLEGALHDPEFMEGLPRILKICQRLHETQGDEVGWLQFRWLLRKNKQGEDNWYRILTEGSGWGKKKRSSAGRDPEFEAYLEKLAEEDRATHT